MQIHLNAPNRGGQPQIKFGRKPNYQEYVALNKLVQDKYPDLLNEKPIYEVMDADKNLSEQLPGALMRLLWKRLTSESPFIHVLMLVNFKTEEQLKRDKAALSDEEITQISPTQLVMRLLR